MGQNYKIISHNTKRGFFSDLIHGILPSVIYLQDNNITTYNIDWVNNLYQSNNFNLFDYFFNINQNFNEYHHFLNNSTCPYGIYFGLNNTHEQLKRGSDAIKEIKLLESPFFKKILIPFDTNLKVLGVQQRKTDHGDITTIINDDILIEMVEKFYVDNGFDKIFLITDSQLTLNKFIDKFQDKITYNECFRSLGSQAIHFHNDYDFDKIKLAEQVLIDSYCLSLTDYKLICNSNVSTFSLLSNYDENNYKYIDK
jgi:hypothetical protein